MKKLLPVLGLRILLIIFSCANDDKGTKKVGRGFGKAFVGVAQLVLSPLQIAAGLLECIAAIPYYMSASPEDIN